MVVCRAFRLFDLVFIVIEKMMDYT